MAGEIVAANLKVLVGGDASRASAEFKKLKAETMAFAGDSKREFDSIGQSIGKASSSLTAFGTRLMATGAGIATAFGGPIKYAIDRASDLNETLNKVDVVFGDSAKVIKDFASSAATSLGQSKEQAAAAAATFGNLFVSMKMPQSEAAKMSTALVKLASDLASFNNIDPGEALEKLRAGISGESEPLKSLGILINDTAVKTKAMELGFKAVKGQFTESQKVAARYALIMEQSKTAVGDFANTSSGLANSQRIVKALFQDLAANIGQVFLPVVGQGAAFVKDLLSRFQELSPAVKDTIAKFLAGGAALGVAAVAIGAVATAFGALLSPIGLVAAAVGVLATAWIRNWGGIQEKSREVFQQLAKFYNDHKQEIEQLVAIGKKALDALGKAFADYVGKVGDSLKIWLKLLNKDWEGAWKDIQDSNKRQLDQELSRWQEWKGKAGEIWQSISRRAVEIWNDLPNQLSEGLEILKAETISAWGLIRTKSVEIWEQVKTSASEKWTEIKAAIVAQVEQLPENIGFALGRLARIAVDKWEEVKQFSEEKWRQLVDGVSGIVQALPGLIASGLKQAVLFVVGSFKDMATGGIEQIVKLPENLADIFTKIVSEVSTWPGKLYQKGKEAFAAFLRGGREGYEQRSPSGFEKDLTRIEKAFIEFPAKLQAQVAPRLKDAGKQMLKNMREAFDEMLRGVNEWARAMGQTAEITAEAWARASVAVRKSILEQRKAFQENKKLFEDVGLILQAFPDDAAAFLGRYINAWDSAVTKIDTNTGLIALSINTLSNAEGTMHAQMIESWLQIEDASDRLKETLTGNARAQAIAIQEENKRAFDASKAQFDDLSNSLPDSFNRIIDQILNGSGRLGKELLKLGVEVKGAFSDVLDIIGLFPGRVGEAMRRGVSEFDRYFNLLDKIISFTQRVFGKEQTGIIGVIQGALGKLGGLFKSTTSVAQSSIQHWQGTWEAAEGGFSSIGKSAESKIGGQVSKAFGAATAAITGFTTGLSVAQATGSRAMGAIAGAAMGALQGFATGGIWGAVIGGIGGLLGGLFGGRSALQKAQEAAALQQAKDAIKISQQAVIKAVEESKQSMLETTAKVRDIIESIRFHTSIGKEPLNAFFKDLDGFWKRFAARMDTWKGLANEEIKKASKTMKAAAEGLALMPQLFESINRHFGLSDAAIDLYFASLDKIAVKLGDLAERTPNSIEKQIRKFSTRIKPGAELLNETTAGIKEMFDLRPVDDSKLDLWGLSLGKIVTKVGQLATEFDKGLVKAVEFFSTKAGAAVALWRDGVEAIKSMVDVPEVREADFNNLINGIRAGLSAMIRMAQEFAGEGLTRAVAIAESSLAISAALKAWVETSNTMRGYTQVAEQTWTDLTNDFKRGLELLNILLNDALAFKEKAAFFESTVKAGAAHLLAGVTAYGSGLTQAFSALNSMLGHIQGGPQPTNGGGSGSEDALRAASSLAYRSGGPVVVHNTYQLHVGDITAEMDSTKGQKILSLMRELVEDKMGRNSLGLLASMG